MTATPEYRDPTASQTHLTEPVFWPRRNWAMKQMLDKWSKPEWYEAAWAVICAGTRRYSHAA